MNFKNSFPKTTYIRITLCVVTFFILLFCYNGIWNTALYPKEVGFAEPISSFINACLMLTPATLIAASFGSLSVLELVCTVEDNEWKTIVEIILWSLLTILVNSFTAYLITIGNLSSIGIWMILIITSVVNIIWYITTIILLKSSKRLHTLAEKLEENESEEDEKKLESRKIGTKDLAYKLLREIGATTQETEEGRIRFGYQGVTFVMEVINECLFINLIWPWCYSFSKFEIDEFARVRQVVNDINMRGTESVFYGITDSDEVAVHIKKHFLFVEQIPDLNGYFKHILDNFFRTARTMEIEIEKRKVTESQ